MARTAYIWDPSSLDHDTGRHVESIVRAERLHPDRMRESVPGIDLHPILLHGAEELVLRVHDEEHHDFVSTAHEHGFRSLDEGDTRISAGSYRAALNAVDAGATAVDGVMSCMYEMAFCAMRPPGHHALPSQSMGFCLFATPSIVARYVQERYGLGRIAILDWDVHHGNGTQHIFWEDPDVFFLSLHQHPLYPGSGLEDETGEGPGEGATLNLTFSPKTDEAKYLSRFEKEAVPALLAFDPEFIILSAGFDAHYGDPLGELLLTPEGFARMTRWVKEVATQSCGGRMVSLLEGGYNLDALESSVGAHLAELCAG